MRINGAKREKHLRSVKIQVMRVHMKHTLYTLELVFLLNVPFGPLKCSSSQLGVPADVRTFQTGPELSIPSWTD